MHPKTLLSYAFLFFGYYFILGAKDSRRRLFRALGIFSDEDLKTLSKEALQKRDSYSVWDKHFNRDDSIKFFVRPEIVHVTSSHFYIPDTPGF